jgi:GNAT superfamily N-acetyltransferase
MTVGTFDGTAEELSALVQRMWTHSYAGKMSFPLWTPEYFRWQFRLDANGSRENLLAVTEGSQVVGVLLGTDYSFRVLDNVVPGSQWSWLSVDPAFRGRGIAPLLDEERVRRLKASHSQLIVSYRFVGSKHSLAERPNSKTPGKIFHKTLGFWARVLQPARFAKWHYSWFDGFLARLATPIAGVPKGHVSDSRIGVFTPADLDDCLSLVQESQQGAALAIDWTRGTLGHHLGGSPVSQTLVMREAGRVTGLVNFHVLPFQGRTVENVGILDIVAFRNSVGSGRARLINAALARMLDQGAVLALKLNCGDTDLSAMLQSLFVPQLPESALVLQWAGTPVPIPSKSRLHLLWR